MNDREKSRDDLVSENVALRHELENIRNLEHQPVVPDISGNGVLCTNLVREVPEYLYSIEFTNKEIPTTIRVEKNKTAFTFAI